jgi:hypothetical protein
MQATLGEEIKHDRCSSASHRFNCCPAVTGSGELRYIRISSASDLIVGDIGYSEWGTSDTSIDKNGFTTTGLYLFTQVFVLDSLCIKRTKQYNSRHSCPLSRNYSFCIRRTISPFV